MNQNISDEAEQAWDRGLDLEASGDFIGAEKAYLIAARLGHTMAQLNLANILDDHRSPPDTSGAEYWYQESWKGGESSAAWNLHVHYNALGDPVSADIWKKRAAAMGHPDAV